MENVIPKTLHKNLLICIMFEISNILELGMGRPAEKGII